MTPSRALAAAALLLTAGCTGNSAAVITVTGDGFSLATLEFSDPVPRRQAPDRFTVPVKDALIPFKLPKTVSVTFPSSVGSYLDVCVDGRLADKLVATGEGFSMSPIVKGGITEVTVPLTLGPQGGVGCGGAADMGGGTVDMGGGD